MSRKTWRSNIILRITAVAPAKRPRWGNVYVAKNSKQADKPSQAAVSPTKCQASGEAVVHQDDGDTRWRTRVQNSRKGGKAGKGGGAPLPRTGENGGKSAGERLGILEPHVYTREKQKNNQTKTSGRWVCIFF